MSYYYDKECNRLLTSKSGQHVLKKHGVYMGMEDDTITVFLGNAYWKNGRRDPVAVSNIIIKLEGIMKRKIAKEEREFIEK